MTAVGSNGCHAGEVVRVQNQRMPEPKINPDPKSRSEAGPGRTVSVTITEARL
jgi:hypothetical protein